MTDAPLSTEELTLVAELAAGNALSADEFDLVARAFPALAAEAAATGLADDSDQELVEAVADPDEIPDGVYDRLCDRAAVIASALAAARTRTS